MLIFACACRAPDTDICVPGTSVKNGQAVRFMHLKTGRNLHTHHFESPLTKQMEVSAYGNDGEGDHLDDWVVETADSPDWRRGDAAVVLWSCPVGRVFVRVAAGCAFVHLATAGSRIPRDFRRRCADEQAADFASRINPTPYTLHSAPCTLHPTPCTLRPTLYALRPTP